LFVCVGLRGETGTRFFPTGVVGAVEVEVLLLLLVVVGVVDSSNKTKEEILV
jgi:hypothetical protein